MLKVNVTTVIGILEITCHLKIAQKEIVMLFSPQEHSTLQNLV